MYPTIVSGTYLSAHWNWFAVHVRAGGWVVGGGGGWVVGGAGGSANGKEKSNY